MPSHSNSAPLARSERLLTEAVGRELVVFDADSGEAHCLPPLAAAVFTSCDGHRDRVALAQAAAERIQEVVTPADVDTVLAQLADKALLTIGPEHSRDATSMSRRGFVRRAAVAGALAVPVIVSVSAPGRAWGGTNVSSCLGQGAVCQTKNDCCACPPNLNGPECVGLNGSPTKVCQCQPPP
jgi:hypothetical protein